MFVKLSVIDFFEKEVCWNSPVKWEIMLNMTSPAQAGIFLLKFWSGTLLWPIFW